MVRTLKDPDVRRNEIVDVAQHLFLTKGYDNTSVQDVLDGAGIAKGTFYHYFGSKMELLDSLVVRLTDTILSTVEPIVTDEQLTTIEKMRAYFDAIMQWKTVNRRFLMDVARVIYAVDNAVYREKMFRASLRRIAPFFASVIVQGIDEGVFTTDYPAEVSEIIYNIMRFLGETMIRLLLDENYEGDMAYEFERIIRSHEYAIGRILGYEGELALIDIEAAKLWVEVAESNERRNAHAQKY
jgi:AcrR family transcriptional regulator